MGLGDARPQLLAAFDQAYNRRSWHGPNLRGSLRGIAAGQAAWRPAPGRHNIWEIAVHAAYWKYAALRRLTGGARGSFPLAGSNWFRRPADGGERAWRADLALLDGIHSHLRQAIETLPAGRLLRPLGRSRVTPFFLVSGATAHDLYHAGQIQLLKALGARRAKGR